MSPLTRHETNMSDIEMHKMEQDALAAIEATRSLSELKQVRARYLGRADGALTLILRKLGTVSIEERTRLGPLAQSLKAKLEQRCDAKEQEILHRGTSPVDATLPPRHPLNGKLHPLTQVRWQLEDIFTRMGFIIADGPEVESEWYNFDALNMPSWHPARDMQDTFYVNAERRGTSRLSQTREDAKKMRLVLRTQTSPVQIRAMEKYGVPLRCIVPGRVYRNEATDARHENAFWQIEGLMIDKDISLAHLITVAKIFLKDLLGDDIGIRVRPGYFPFTEPSIEMDITCQLCTEQRGKSAQNNAEVKCPVCKGTEWLEFMGAGLVHPFVLNAGGVDPKKYSGFAFGFGLTRLVMMKYGVSDIRLLTSGDIRFLKQF